MAICQQDAATQPLHTATQLFQTAFELVIKDESFSIPSASAVRARELARSQIEWYSTPENTPRCNSFAAKLYRSLQDCCSSYRSGKLQRERMWESYFRLRSSDKFKEDWRTFITEFDKSKSGESCPALYLFVTDIVFEDIIKTTHPVDRLQQENDPSLSLEEKNVIQYTSGYVLRALVKKIQRSAHPFKDEMIMCLNELTENEMNVDTEDPSRKWVNAVDRGGLKHVSDMTYMFFISLEVALRRQLSKRKTSELAHLKQIQLIIENDEDASFYWSIVSANWGMEEGQALLHLIINHWITLRGFSLAGAFMEKFKCKNKTPIQKSKGFRKSLPTK